MWDPQSLRGDLHGKSIPHPLSHRCAGRNEDMSAELSDRESPGPRAGDCPYQPWTTPVRTDVTGYFV